MARLPSPARSRLPTWLMSFNVHYSPVERPCAMLKLTARLGVPLIPSFSRRGRRGFFACSGSMPKQIAKLAPLTKSLIVPNPSRLNEGLRDSVMIQGLRTIFALLWRESASVRGNRWSIGKRAKTSQKAPPDVRSREQRLPLRKWHAQRFSWIYLPHPILLPPGEKELFLQAMAVHPNTLPSSHPWLTR